MSAAETASPAADFLETRSRKRLPTESYCGPFRSLRTPAADCLFPRDAAGVSRSRESKILDHSEPALCSFFFSATRFRYSATIGPPSALRCRSARTVSENTRRPSSRRIPVPSPPTSTSCEPSAACRGTPDSCASWTHGAVRCGVPCTSPVCHRSPEILLSLQRTFPQISSTTAVRLPAPLQPSKATQTALTL